MTKANSFCQTGCDPGQAAAHASQKTDEIWPPKDAAAADFLKWQG